MIRSGDISARGDTDAGLYVAVLSNSTHLQAGELVQWLPASALDAAIGNIGGPALRRAASIVGAPVDHS